MGQVNKRQLNNVRKYALVLGFQSTVLNKAAHEHMLNTTYSFVFIRVNLIRQIKLTPDEDMEQHLCIGVEDPPLRSH